MSMYVRVKRKNQTVFLLTEPTDTVGDVKSKLASINDVPASSIRLLFRDEVLENDKSIADSKIENENIIFAVYKKEGSEDYEEVDIQKHDSGAGSS